MGEERVQYRLAGRRVLRRLARSTGLKDWICVGEGVGV